MAEPELERACGLLADIGELADYATSISRVATHLLCTIDEPGELGDDGVPHRASPRDLRNLFELLCLLTTDIHTLTGCCVAPPALHSRRGPPDFTAMAARAVKA